MSDDGSVGGGLTSIISEGTNKLSEEPKEAVNAILGQLKGPPKPEEEAKRQANNVSKAQRLQEITEELNQIRAQRAQLEGPQIPNSSEQQSLVIQQQRKGPTIDEASRQAVGRAEQGRNFKG